MKTALAQGIYDKLRNNAGVSALVGTRIRNQFAPQGLALPYIVFNQAAGGYEDDTAGEMFNGLIQMDCWAETRTAADSILDAVIALFQDDTLTVSGWNVFWVHHETQRTDFEEQSGKQYYRASGDFRVRMQKVS